MYLNAIFWISLKNAPDKGFAFWQTRSNDSILHNSVPADCLEKVVHTQTEEILHQKIHLSPRLPPKIILESAWQLQYEGHAQRGDRTVANEMTIGPKIDFWIQGISHAEVEQDDEKIRKQDIARLL